MIILVVFTSGKNEKDKLELTNKQMEYICKMLINQCFDYGIEETKNIIHEYEQGYSANLPAFGRYQSMFTADLYNEHIKPYCKHEEESKAIFDFIFCIMQDNFQNTVAQIMKIQYIIHTDRKMAIIGCVQMV